MSEAMATILIGQQSDYSHLWPLIHLSISTSGYLLQEAFSDHCCPFNPLCSPSILTIPVVEEEG